MIWTRGGRVSAWLWEVTLTGDATNWYLAKSFGDHPVALADVDAVLMRKDPPFDSEYFYATHLLGQAEREGARVFNKPAALRDHPEKLAILEFPQFITPTLMGQRLELNPFAVFLAIAFCTWFWGPIGAFLAVPLLMALTVALEHAFGDEKPALPN